ncbi:hypothetical protein I4U23_000618 [Adineta vaga]|nr:hypothetical protein I4U23_000618 [Adineta vaga]
MTEDHSTLFDQYDIQISNTERRNSSIAIQDCYIVYLIECRLKSNKDSESTCVFRRYSDFETLRNYLVAKYSWVIVPVLPEKTISHTWSKSHQDRTSVEVVERRRVLLERFLRHLCAHPTLSADSAVQTFLLQNDGWKQIVDTSHVLNKSESLIPSFKLNLMQHERTKDKRFLDAYQYAIDLNNVLYNILRARAKLADRIFLYYQSHNQFGRLFSEWSTTEDKLGDSLQRAGHFLDSFAGQIEEYLHEEDALMDFIKHQASYCDVIKSVVEKHEQLVEDNCKQETSLGTKRSQRDAYANGKMNFSVNSLKSKLFGENDQTRYAKIDTMDSNINDAVLHCQNADIRVKEFNKNALIELDFYKTMKEEQMREILRSYCLLQARIAKAIRLCFYDIDWFFYKKKTSDLICFMSRKISQPRSTGLKDISNKFSKVQIGTKTTNQKSPTKPSAIDNLIDSIKNGKYKRIIVLAGAGISTPSGIPDFRTPGTGLYDNLRRYNIPYPEAIFELDYFYRNPKPFFHLAKELYPGRYVPNVIHYFIRYLHDQNILHRVYTQNIDGLERMAGIPADKIVEAHGTFMTATCQRCGQKYTCEDIRQRIVDDEIPKCTKNSRCTGVIKPDIVFFGEDLPRRFDMYSRDLPICDCCIVMGTSLAVAPFSDIVDSVSRVTVRLLINRQVVGTFLSPRSHDVTMIGDLEVNIKEFLTKLDVIDQVMELMKKENAENEKHRTIQMKTMATNSTTNNRFKSAEKFIEQSGNFITLTQPKQDRRITTEPKIVSNESTKSMIEKHNNALIFNRRGTKPILPVIPSKKLSPSSSSSSSESLDSSLSETELKPFVFNR